MFKKLIIIALILLAVISIGAVSAAEKVSDTNIKTPEINEEKINEVEVVSDGDEFEESIENSIYTYDYVDTSYYYDSQILHVSYVGEASGNISIDIGGKQVYNNPIQSFQDIYWRDLSVKPDSFGLQNVTFVYTGCDLYDSFTKSSLIYFDYSFNVNHYQVSDEQFMFNINLPNAATGIVNFNINGKNYENISLENQRYLYVDYNDLHLGPNSLIVTYEGDANYHKKKFSRLFDVNPIINFPDRYIIGEEEFYFSIIIPSHETGLLRLSWLYGEGDFNPDFENNKISKFVYVENGSAKVKLHKCCNNSDTFQYDFLGTIRRTNEFYVNYVDHDHVITVNHPNEITEGETAKITLYNNNESDVHLNLFIDDVLLMSNFKLSDRLNISIPILSVGTHKIVIKSNDRWDNEFYFYHLFNITVNKNESAVNDIVDGNSSNNNSTNHDMLNNTNNSTSNNDSNPSSVINPTNLKVSLSLKSVKVKKSAKKLVLTATLKINNQIAKYKVVKFKFNGKTYKVKTNSKGVAKLPIKKSILQKLKVGKKISYKVDYADVSVKKSAVVKK